MAWALARYERVETIGFDYGQRHRVELAQRPRVRAELAALNPDWARALGEDRLVDLTGYGAIAESALTSARRIEMAANGLPTTFVPGRNLLFLAAAAAHAYRRGISTLVGGMCETDFSGYPDCRRETIDAMERALSLGLAAPLTVETPLMRLSKADTWALAHELGGDALVDLIRTETHTCYEGDRTMHDWGAGCGLCPACALRRNGWSAWRARA